MIIRGDFLGENFAYKLIKKKIKTISDDVKVDMIKSLQILGNLINKSRERESWL